MSGGQLVVLDRAGSAVKMYELPRGLATLGSRAPADIRIMLPEVLPHHATITVHNSQTVIRNVGEGETLVNGESVSVAALQHKDVITIGGRDLRWEYTAPSKRQQVSPGLRKLPAVRSGARAAGGARRASAGGAPPPPRDRALQLAIEMSHRASMPASSGGKQVAIVQPQRRDHSEHNNVPENTTQATLWIESRKSSPRRRPASPPPPPARRSLPAPRARRSTPLRLTVLRRAQTAHKMKVVKIEAPSKIDHTKQAAIMLMTGHTARARLSLGSPSYVVKKPSPARKSSARKSSARKSSARKGRGSLTPGEGSARALTSLQQAVRRSSKRTSNNNSVSVVEISDSDSQSAACSSRFSPALPTPRKSALKDFSKKSARKTESIKFDLSNLEGYQEESTRCESEESADLTLHYSETSSRGFQHSRGGRMLQRVGLGLAAARSPAARASTEPAESAAKRSNRGTIMLQRALDGSDPSGNTTLASAFRTRTLTPRNNMESFSIVDLVSLNSDASQRDRTGSLYDSIDSVDTTAFATPNVSDRKSRSLLGCSTPYASARPARSGSIPEVGRRSTRGSASARRSKSLSTPESRSASALGAAPGRRAPGTRSRIHNTDLQLLDATEMNDSPKSSRRSRATDAAPTDISKANDTVASERGMTTPENRLSPVEAGTPVLSIQSFLDSSRSSSRSSAGKRKSKSRARRKTIGVPSAAKRRSAAKSKSLGAAAAARASLGVESERQPADEEQKVTPRASTRLEQQGVKNQHSTAKKPQSRRSIIDDLDRSDIVKQLFNSPVKRKLSRSMMEFERRYKEEAVAARPARHTLAAVPRAEDDSLSDVSGTFTPERFVSPIGTPAARSPDLAAVERLLHDTPDTEPSDVRDARTSPRSRGTRSSLKNDLGDITGLKLVFARSPRNRLSDVRVKEVFRRSPANDLRRVSGVKSLFGKGTSPKNDLSNVGGVKRLFRRSPNNDLRNVSGVKRTLRNSPRNDLTDVRGVKRLFNHGTRKRRSHDLSGVEELFDESNRSRSSEALFDNLVGKPTVHRVYSRTFCARVSPAAERRKGTFHVSLERIPDGVAVQAGELGGRLPTREPLNVTKEMQKLVTATKEGSSPLVASRTRNSSLKQSASESYGAHTLPIKKRSLASPRAAPRLPLKKRAVLHSTPVKGRHSLTMNASELGRVSPIRALDNTHAHDSTLTRKTLQKTIPETASTKGEETVQKSPKLSPKASISKANPPASPKGKAASRPKASLKKVKTPPKRDRFTRNRKNTTNESTSKKTRPSLVVGKKAPVMSPEATAPPSPPPRRAAARKQEQKPSSPAKRTRVLKDRPAVVVLKQSPKLNPRAGKQDSRVEDEPKGTRRNLAVHFESPKKSPAKTRAKKNYINAKENKTDIVSEEKSKRGRKPAAVEIEPPRRRGRGAEANAQNVKTTGKASKADKPEVKPKGRGKKVDEPAMKPKGRGKKVDEPEVKPKGRGKKVDEPEVKPKERGKKVDEPEVKPKGRGKKVDEPEMKPKGRGKKVDEPEVKPKGRGKKVDEPEVKQSKGRGKKVEAVDVPSTRRGRSNVEKVSGELQPKTGRKKAEPTQPAETKPKTGKKIEVQASTRPEPVRRGRRAKADQEDDTVIAVPLLVENRRKRKTVPVEEVPAKVARTVSRRGKQEPEPAATDKKPAAKPRTTKEKADTRPASKTRGKKVEVVAAAPTKPTRGRKVAEPKETPVAEKRKTKVEASPVKGKKPSPSVAKKPRRAEPAPAGGRTRARAVESVSAGRSRRRR